MYVVKQGIRGEYESTGIILAIAAPHGSPKY